MQHIVMMILHVMEDLIFLMLNIQHVVSFIKVVLKYYKKIYTIYFSLCDFDQYFLV